MRDCLVWVWLRVALHTHLLLTGGPQRLRSGTGERVASLLGSGKERESYGRDSKNFSSGDPARLLVPQKKHTKTKKLAAVGFTKRYIIALSSAFLPIYANSVENKYAKETSPRKKL